MKANVKNNAYVGVKKKEIRIAAYCCGFKEETNRVDDLLKEFKEKYFRTIFFDENTKAELNLKSEVYMEAPWEFNKPAEERQYFTQLMANANRQKITAVIITDPSYYASNLDDFKKIITKFLSMKIRVFTPIGDEYLMKNGSLFIRSYGLILKDLVDDPNNPYHFVLSQDESQQLWCDNIHKQYYIYEPAPNGEEVQVFFDAKMLIVKKADDFDKNGLSDEEESALKKLREFGAVIVKFTLCDITGNKVYAWVYKDTEN